MATELYAENLKSSLDVQGINEYFSQNPRKTLEVLQKVRPEGQVAGGRFKLASEMGGAGTSFDYNYHEGVWGDWAKGHSAYGLVGFLSTTLKCSAAQAVEFLVKEELLDKSEAKKALAEHEGDPLVLPVPHDRADWEYVLESQVLRKDRGILKGHWTYRDVDGSLLGYKYRVDQRSTAKEVYTLTYRAESGWAKKAWQKKYVPAYGLEKLGQGPNVRVMFVEGEKAADKAQEILGGRWKVLAFSGVASTSALWIPDAEWWEDVEVVLWPDNDVAGKEAMRKVQLMLQSMQHKPREIRIVRVEAIPGLPPKWDLGDYDENCGVDVGVEMERAEKIDSFERVGREWVYVTQQDQFYNLEDRALVWSASAFDRRYSRYSDKNGSASKKFLSDLETLKMDDLEFVPGDKTFITTSKGKTFLNEWYPTEVYQEGMRIARDPDVSDEEIAEKARYFIEHVHRITGDEVVEPEKDPSTGEIIPATVGRTLDDAVFSYFRDVVVWPMNKHGWFLCMLSAENGTGKSYFKDLMVAIMGGNRCTVVNTNRYLKEFEDWRDGTLFYELAEVKAQESTQVYDQIKQNHNFKPFDFERMQDRQAGAQKLNIKTRGMKNQRDFLNGYLTSNDLFPLAISGGGSEDSDRRLLVILCHQRLSDEQQIHLFDEELRTRPEWVAAWLMRFKSKYQWSRSWAPVTAHKREMFEKDRERAEARNDKYELGKYDDFYQYIRWAKNEKFGGFARKVVTGETIRDLCDVRRIRIPFNERFDKILVRAGILRGPDLKVDGALKVVYTTDPNILVSDAKTWREELGRSINNPEF